MDNLFVNEDHQPSTDFVAMFSGDDPKEPEESNRNYRAALSWRVKGYNVVPQKAPAIKHPGVRWKNLQTRPVSDDELSQWVSMFSNGVGFITGAISGVIVIESDGLAGETVLDLFEAKHGPLPPTLTIRSGSGRGFHRHFCHPGGRIKTVANPAIKLDIKGDGGFCVLPPSIHKSGGRYEIVRDLPPAPLPEGLLDFIAAKAAEANAREGRKRMPSGAAASEAVRQRGGRPPVPLNLTNVLIVQSALAALPDIYADDYGLWFLVGCALHDFDCGAVGLAMWRRFSERSPDKAKMTDFDKMWASLGRPYDGKRTTLGSLIFDARALGWRMPCRWDRSAMTVIERDDDE